MGWIEFFVGYIHRKAKIGSRHQVVRLFATYIEGCERERNLIAFSGFGPDGKRHLSI